MPDDRRARTADHSGIDRLAAELLPALIAKLGTTNLGELEVREGAWRVRLRRPASAGVNYGRRAGDRPSRAHPGHEGHGHSPGAVEGSRAGKGGVIVTVTGGPGGPVLAAVGPGRPGGEPPGDADHGPADPARIFATSPAVGVFQPLAGLAVGARVRKGDRLGSVDMLGIGHEVSAPVDGILGPLVADAGTAVEYGQELVRIEPLAVPEPA